MSGILVPRHWLLDGFTAEMVQAEGVAIAELDPITALRVQTQDTLYEIIVINQFPDILVFGGRFFPLRTKAVFGGSSGCGGSCLRMAWIGVGYSMEIYPPDGLVITLPVQSIKIVDCANFLGPF